MKSHGQGFQTVNVLEYDPNKGFTEKSLTVGQPSTSRPGGSGMVVLQNELPQPTDPQRADNAGR
jgi:hypothetical protein